MTFILHCWLNLWHTLCWITSWIKTGRKKKKRSNEMIFQYMGEHLNLICRHASNKHKAKIQLQAVWESYLIYCTQRHQHYICSCFSICSFKKTHKAATVQPLLLVSRYRAVIFLKSKLENSQGRTDT